MICLAFAAVTQHSGPPIHMVMHYMFMLTYIFSFQRGNNKCMRRAKHLENRSLLLNVDSATLPPSGTQTQCRQGAFHYHNLQAVDFLPQSSRDIDRLHICSFKIDGFSFLQAFLWHAKNMPCVYIRLQSCSCNCRLKQNFTFFFSSHILDVFAPVSHFQTAVMDDSYVKFTWHHLLEAAGKAILLYYINKNDILTSHPHRLPDVTKHTLVSYDDMIDRYHTD